MFKAGFDEFVTIVAVLVARYGLVLVLPFNLRQFILPFTADIAERRTFNIEHLLALLSVDNFSYGYLNSILPFSRRLSRC